LVEPGIQGLLVRLPNTLAGKHTPVFWGVLIVCISLEH
jgi:hypothetical protein